MKSTNIEILKTVTLSGKKAWRWLCKGALRGRKGYKKAAHKAARRSHKISIKNPDKELDSYRNMTGRDVI